MNLTSAIQICRDSGLTGWELVAFAQHLVNKQMKYSVENSLDSPQLAYKKGQGYCWHQASALNLILLELGFDSRRVHAFRNLFPEVELAGVTVHNFISGHVWCRVKIDGVEKDVCPGSKDNVPGIIPFTPLGKVYNWNRVIEMLTYYGSALVNAHRGKKYGAVKGKQENRWNPENAPVRKPDASDIKTARPARPTTMPKTDCPIVNDKQVKWIKNIRRTAVLEKAVISPRFFGFPQNDNFRGCMKKNIIIAGVPRAGKTTVSHLLAQKYGYQHLCFDAINAGFEHCFPQLGIDTYANKSSMDKLYTISGKIAPFINAMFASEEYEKYERGLVIDVYQLLPEDYVKHIDLAFCDIYYFVTGDATPEERFAQLRQYDTTIEYTYHLSDPVMRIVSADIVEQSRLMRGQCEKYGLPCYETAKDRDRVIADFIEMVGRIYSEAT